MSQITDKSVAMRVAAAELRGSIQSIRRLVAAGITDGVAWEMAKERQRDAELVWNRIIATVGIPAWARARRGADLSDRSDP